MKTNFKKILFAVVLTICIYTNSMAQWTQDPANLSNIYNTGLTGKVGIGVVPVVDGIIGPYTNLSPTVQIKGPSGMTGGTALIPLPVLQIASTNYPGTLGLGIYGVFYPEPYQYAFINTENRLKIQSPEFEVQGTSYMKSKVIIDNNYPALPTPGNYRLYVTGGILTEKIKVALKADAVNWSDFVFAKDYKLRSLCEVEAYVNANKHLPEIPSSEEVYRDGIDLVQMDAKLLMKIEELTLYMIEMKKEIEVLKNENKKLKNKR